MTPVIRETGWYHQQLCIFSVRTTSYELADIEKIPHDHSIRHRHPSCCSIFANYTFPVNIRTTFTYDYIGFLTCCGYFAPAAIRLHPMQHFQQLLQHFQRMLQNISSSPNSKCHIFMSVRLPVWLSVSNIVDNCQNEFSWNFGLNLGAGSLVSVTKMVHVKRNVLSSFPTSRAPSMEGVVFFFKSHRM